jgi:phage anti-repressor protein
MKVYEHEKNLAKCKDICITNRDELNKELRRTFLGGSGIPPESTYFIDDEE